MYVFVCIVSITIYVFEKYIHMHAYTYNTYMYIHACIWIHEYTDINIQYNNLCTYVQVHTIPTYTCIYIEYVHILTIHADIVIYI